MVVARQAAIRPPLSVSDCHSPAQCNTAQHAQSLRAEHTDMFEANFPSWRTTRHHWHDTLNDTIVNWFPLVIDFFLHPTAALPCH